MRRTCFEHGIGPGLREIDYVLIDLSGSRPVGTITQVLRAYEQALPPKIAFVVKNYPLVRLLTNCTIHCAQNPSGRGVNADQGGAGGSACTRAEADDGELGGSSIYCEDGALFAAAAVVAGLGLAVSAGGDAISYKLVVEIPRPSLKVAAVVLSGIGMISWLKERLRPS